MTDNVPYNFQDEPEIKSLTSQVERAMLLPIVETLSNFLIKTDAYSINARALGINAPAFMIAGGLFCLNPRLLLYGNNRVKMHEFSAISKEMIPIRRPEGIVVSYENYMYERVVRDLVGIEARYFQHELDNLSGIDWRTRATQSDRLNAVKRVLN